MKHSLHGQTGERADRVSKPVKLKTDYLKYLLDFYYPLHFFAVFRSHELYNVEPFIHLLRSPILDFGCGDGTIASLLFGSEVDYGLDVSRSAARIAAQRQAYKVTLLADGLAIPLPGGSLGGVFSNCVLEHVAVIPSTIREIARVLQSGAYFVATCLSPSYYTMNPVFSFVDRPLLGRLRSRMIGEENRLHNHVSVHSVEEYQRMFSDNGMLLEGHSHYAPEPVARFCSKWDTLSKYRVPYPFGLRHTGFLIRYLRLRYTRFASKEETVTRWYHRFYPICYDRMNSGRIGVGQILVARKL
jgi:SAM-dependent methyltransferase